MNTFTIDTIDNDAGDTDNVDDDANMMEILVKSWHLFYHNVSSTTNRAKVAKFDKRKIRSEQEKRQIRSSYHIIFISFIIRNQIKSEK